MKFQVNQRVRYAEKGYWLNGKVGIVEAVNMQAGDGVMRYLVHFPQCKTIVAEANLADASDVEIPLPQPEAGPGTVLNSPFDSRNIGKA